MTLNGNRAKDLAIDLRKRGGKSVETKVIRAIIFPDSFAERGLARGIAQVDFFIVLATLCKTLDRLTRADILDTLIDKFNIQY